MAVDDIVRRSKIEVTTKNGVVTLTGNIDSGEAPEPGRTIGVTIDDVDTRDGVVFLTGRLGSEKEKEQAIKLARETNGVSDVQPNLTIGKG